MTTVANNLICAHQLVDVTGKKMSDSARLDVELILAFVLQKERSWLFTWPDYTLSEQDQCRFDSLFSRRKGGEPVAHIIGTRGFWTLDLDVNDSTLIPRPDTETLIEVALSLALPATSQVLDLGTGSGAIALALASEQASWCLLAVDKVPESVALAQRNCLNLGLKNVSIERSDWFSVIESGRHFDLIVSNPPYIDPTDPHLQEGDVRFEPLSALVADEAGMADLYFIIKHAVAHLRRQGWLVLEHGCDQAELVRSALTRQGFVQVQTRRDFGGHERISYGQLSG